MEQEITEGSRLACSEAPGASACLARHRGEWIQWAQKHTTGVYESVENSTLSLTSTCPFIPRQAGPLGPGRLTDSVFDVRRCGATLIL